MRHGPVGVHHGAVLEHGSRGGRALGAVGSAGPVGVAVGRGRARVRNRARIRRRHRVRVVDLPEHHVAVSVGGAVGHLGARGVVGHAELEAVQRVRAVHGLARVQLHGRAGRNIGVVERHAAGLRAVAGPHLLAQVAVQVVVRLEVVRAVAGARHRKLHQVVGVVVGDAALHGAGGLVHAARVGRGCAGVQLGQVVRERALARHREAVERDRPVGAGGAAGHAHRAAVGTGRGHQVAERDAGQVRAGRGRGGLPRRGRPRDLVGVVHVRERNRLHGLAGLVLEDAAHVGGKLAVAVVNQHDVHVVGRRVVGHAEHGARAGHNLAQQVVERAAARSVLAGRDARQVVRVVAQAEGEGAAGALPAVRHDRRGLGGVVRVGRLVLGAVVGDGHQAEAVVATRQVGALGQVLDHLGAAQRRGGPAVLQVAVLKVQAAPGRALGVAHRDAQRAVAVVDDRHAHVVAGLARHGRHAAGQVGHGLAHRVGERGRAPAGAVVNQRHGAEPVGHDRARKALAGVLLPQRVRDRRERQRACLALGARRVRGARHQVVCGVGHLERELARLGGAAVQRLGGRDGRLALSADLPARRVGVGEREREALGHRLAVGIQDARLQPAGAVVGHAHRKVVAGGRALGGLHAGGQVALAHALGDGVADRPLQGDALVGGLVHRGVAHRHGLRERGAVKGKHAVARQRHGSRLAVGRRAREAVQHGLVAGPGAARGDVELELAARLCAAEQRLGGAHRHGRLAVHAVQRVGEGGRGLLGAARHGAGHRGRVLLPAGRRLILGQLLAHLVGGTRRQPTHGDGLPALERERRHPVVGRGRRVVDKRQRALGGGAVGSRQRVGVRARKRGALGVAQGQRERERLVVRAARRAAGPLHHLDVLGHRQRARLHLGAGHGVGLGGRVVAQLNAGRVVRPRGQGGLGHARLEAHRVGALLCRKRPRQLLGLRTRGVVRGSLELPLGRVGAVDLGRAVHVRQADGQDVRHRGGRAGARVVGKRHLVGEHVAHLHAARLAHAKDKLLLRARVRDRVGVHRGGVAADDEAHACGVLHRAVSRLGIRAGLVHRHLEAHRAARLGRGLRDGPGDGLAVLGHLDLAGPVVPVNERRGSGHQRGSGGHGVRNHHVGGDVVALGVRGEVGPGNLVGKHVARAHQLAVGVRDGGLGVGRRGHVHALGGHGRRIDVGEARRVLVGDARRDRQVVDLLARPLGHAPTLRQAVRVFDHREGRACGHPGDDHALAAPEREPRKAELLAIALHNLERHRTRAALDRLAGGEVVQLVGVVAHRVQGAAIPIRRQCDHLEPEGGVGGRGAVRQRAAHALLDDGLPGVHVVVHVHVHADGTARDGGRVAQLYDAVDALAPERVGGDHGVERDGPTLTGLGAPDLPHDGDDAVVGTGHRAAVGLDVLDRVVVGLHALGQHVRDGQQVLAVLGPGVVGRVGPVDLVGDARAQPHRMPVDAGALGVVGMLGVVRLHGRGGGVGHMAVHRGRVVHREQRVTRHPGGERHGHVRAGGQVGQLPRQRLRAARVGGNLGLDRLGVRAAHRDDGAAGHICEAGGQGVHHGRAGALAVGVLERHGVGELVAHLHGSVRVGGGVRVGRVAAAPGHGHRLRRLHVGVGEAGARGHCGALVVHRGRDGAAGRGRRTLVVQGRRLLEVLDGRLGHAVARARGQARDYRRLPGLQRDGAAAGDCPAVPGFTRAARGVAVSTVGAVAGLGAVHAHRRRAVLVGYVIRI